MIILINRVYEVVIDELWNMVVVYINVKDLMGYWMKIELLRLIGIVMV